MVRQQDAAWQAQNGGPRDPQGGNLPGGRVDVRNFAGTQPIFQTAAGPASPAGEPAPLTDEQLAPIVAEAERRWAEAIGAGDGRLAALVGARVVVGNLPDGWLGVTIGNQIIIDSDAAGHGWFVDPSPGDDSEFTTPGDQGELGRMDLLTVVMHELGHVLGFKDNDGEAMDEALDPGIRLEPTTDEGAVVADTAAGPTGTEPDRPAGRGLFDDIAAVVPAAAVGVPVDPVNGDHRLPDDDLPAWLLAAGPRKRKAFLASWLHLIGSEDVGTASV
jgi:hypothetical protein